MHEARDHNICELNKHTILVLKLVMKSATTVKKPSEWNQI